MLSEISPQKPNIPNFLWVVWIKKHHLKVVKSKIANLRFTADLPSSHHKSDPQFNLPVGPWEGTIEAAVWTADWSRSRRRLWSLAWRLLLTPSCPTPPHPTPPNHVVSGDTLSLRINAIQCDTPILRTQPDWCVVPPVLRIFSYLPSKETPCRPRALVLWKVFVCVCVCVASLCHFANVVGWWKKGGKKRK